MKRLYQTYFGALGAVVLFSGLCEILVAAAGHRLELSAVVFAGETFRGIWGGMVMVFAGLFYLAGIRNFGEVHQLAKVLIGSILVWIMAGTDLFALLAAALPSAEDDRWTNSLSQILQTLAPPYSTAVILLPFSLLVAPCLRRIGRDLDAKPDNLPAANP
jgi:hypothetical protein